MNRVLILLCGLMSISGAAWGQWIDSCTQFNRREPVCRAMKNIRSHVMIIDSQRELVQNNFEYMELTLAGLSQVVGKLMTDSSASVHMQDLQAVRTITEKALREARSKSADTYQTSNQIKVTCQKCHNADSESGLKYEDIFKVRWEKTSDRCNEPGRNPFVCKHMYGLFTIFESFEAASLQGNYNFKLAAANAQEVIRITDTLLAFNNPIHPMGNQGIQDLKNEAVALKDLAEKYSPEVYTRGVGLSQACIKCHTAQASRSPTF